MKAVHLFCRTPIVRYAVEFGDAGQFAGLLDVIILQHTFNSPFAILLTINFPVKPVSLKEVQCTEFA